MKFSKTKIDGVILIELNVFSDQRGFFMEAYKKSIFAQNGLPMEFTQDNCSRSVKGVLRGLHFQLKPHPMGKLVRCLRGEIFDVGVDMRRGSPTFGKWIGEILSEENKKMFYFPPSFAHGFYTLSDVAEVLYKCSGEYNKESERGLLWNDPDVGIKWPIKDNLVIISEKDQKNFSFKDIETNY
jgi:dTDP-4-dehydrorhamnose 3,5-epimerase